MWKKLWGLLKLKYDLIFNNTRTKFTMMRNKFLPHTKYNGSVSCINEISSPLK
jgi:hypothetical protein